MVCGKIQLLNLPQSKLPSVEDSLSEEIEAIGHAQRVISNTESQIAGLQADTEHEIKMLKHKLQDVEQQLVVWSYL